MQNFDKIIDYKKFYFKYIKSPEESDNDQYIGFCIFHKDEKQRSFSFNTKTGQWICFAGCGEGNIFDFVEKYKGIKNSHDKIKWLENELDIKLAFHKIINKSVYRHFHKALLDSHGTIEWLQNKRGLNIDTLKQYKIGLRNNRITIPIFNPKKECINIRLYSFKPDTKNTSKMINYTEGVGTSKVRYGGIQLYPIENLSKKKILIVEGEMDCLLMNQSGFNTITVTGGAGAFKAEWLQLFKGRQINICFDIDMAGRKGAQRIAHMIEDYVEWVKIVPLDSAISEPKNADVTDYIVNFNYTPKDFNDLLKQAKLYKDITKDVKQVRQQSHKKVELAMASHFANAMRNIEVVALVAGKNFPPYEIPNKLNVTCNGSFSEKVCPFCPMFMVKDYKKTILMEDTVDEGSLLNLIDITDTQLHGAIKKIIKLPSRCDRVNIETSTYANIEEISLIPEIDFSDDENYEYVQQIAYYKGHGINTNHVYTFRGLALPDPRTQQATQIFHEAKPAVDSIDSFIMTNEIMKELLVFQVKGEELKDIFNVYKKRYDDIEIISGIYERMDIALAYDLVMHSVLDVNFQNKTEKGWMECLLLGDSGCGKTELAKAMIRYYRVGEFITGENATVAGLIGGLSQNGKHWVLNWGKIPLNNRRILFIDELSGMTVEDIGLFSGIRSSGIAELTKIRTEKTLAKTRKVWIGNPRKIGSTTRNLMEYPYGCIAVRDLIGSLEDIRRFDFVVTAHAGEVSPNIYNKKRKLKHPKVGSDTYHKLIMWAWSRKKNQIIFHQKTVDKILEYAGIMGRKYYHGIPIVEAADQRLKIMRGATAIAVLMFSTNKIGDQIIVKPEHVEFFYGWLDRIYDKKSLRYGDWSKRELSKKTLKNIKEIDGVITNDIIEILMDIERMNLSSLIQITGW